MKHFEYNDQIYTAKELADLTGIKYSTLCDRVKRGYSVEQAVSDQSRVPESIEVFIDCSHPADWDGMTNEELYQIYRNWCLKNSFMPETMVHFGRCLKRTVRNLRIVPTRLKEYGNVKYKRVIRVDEY